MWTGGMTFADSIIISLVGLLVVFSALAVLAIAVIIISKVIGTLFKESAPKAAAAVAAPAPAIDEESYAVLLAAVSEEARLSGEAVPCNKYQRTVKNKKPKTQKKERM